MTEVVNESATEGKAKSKASPKLDIEDAVKAGVAKWVDENLRNTSFSRDTPAWNTLQEALPKLPGAIMKEVK